MYGSGDPLSIYAAIRLWDGYLRARMPRDRETAAEAFRIDLMGLIASFSAYTPEKLRDRATADAIQLSGTEMKIDLWYPPRTSIECVTAYGSFLPVFLYYHTRLAEWGLYFRSCKVCGRIFLAKSQKYTLCSDKCRKKQGTQAKREFDARAVENEYDHIYKNEAQRWLHHIHRMEKSIDYTPERIDEARSAYEEFKKEAKKKKKTPSRTVSPPSPSSEIGQYDNWTAFCDTA